MSIHDDFVGQLPDTDPDETREWMESLDAVASVKGRSRAEFLMQKLLERSHDLHFGIPAPVRTPYVNSIPRQDQDQQYWFPGDEDLERRIRAFIRWNAAVMVIKANKAADGIGGHLATFASSAALYEVGFNHFWRGKDHGQAGDAVHIQGHAAPGIYARAYLEGRLDEEQLDGFRRELRGKGLSSYPHPRLMPDFWEYPTVSMGLAPISSIYQARFNRYLHARQLDATDATKVWCFLGDGETDEPESLGSIALAARESLDNLIWVVNCNLQRLDGPVRGNGKIIQELEAVFRGAGWNVIKVIWGSRWDELLARDVDGVLLDKMNTTVDGDFQRYATADGAHIRDHFFGPDPRLRAMVEDFTDDELRTLPRGGHDYHKLYAAYRAATEHRGAPTVILAKTVKGWTLGEGVEARNATHQIKKMTITQLRTLRERLFLQEEIPEGALAEDRDPPYYRPPEGSAAHTYLMERRQALGGPLPSRIVRTKSELPLPPREAFAELLGGSGKQAVSTTMAFTRLLRALARTEGFGRRIVPIIPDEARTFGMDSLFKEFGIYASQGQQYEPVDHSLLLSYTEAKDGQLLEEGITEAGSIASWTAAATSYATRGVPMVPFFIFYSMFGFQRVGDLIWQAGDARAKGFLMGATAGRTTLLGEGLQHQDGHSHLLASTVPACRAYDPAFAYEVATLVQHGITHMYGPDAEDVFYYLTLYNENHPMPAMPEGAAEGIVEGLYHWADAPEGTPARASVLFSGTAHLAARAAQAELAEHHGVGVDLWSAPGYKQLREEALAVERWNRLHPTEPARIPRVTQLLHSGEGPIVAVTDFMAAVPDQISRWSPRPYTSLGTDGYGRSDTREALRSFFETDAGHVVVAVLASLAREGDIDPSEVAKATARHGIDVDVAPPWTR
ncbi:pyruvate dehydrogenase (acetyl-transferring), homodimeric type [Iamia sp.]|uniref:pyruvate dehydrogenase (acetyl-transferring), homodimeric type n=1 Tax=Iamia sp. TaxID=2722710 RepID=UPI002CB1564C|nr:pyruvate dehydrogenase (acetyl-transferring), homodimeric type [Iamia sp.]HXH56285.1 pyruvate dehydrogenase (acetyl-transferring), homodimeric type [Iamia sp.]